METKFSEFQFAYSITREIEDQLVFSGLGLGMPAIPNQRVEALFGYDVKFKGPIISLFLQYKLPVKLTRRNAKEWPEFNREYFRISIYPDNESHQHNILCDIARQDRRNQVFYCAPAFTEELELYDYHNAHQVAQNSVFINCYELPQINGSDEHNICYAIDPEDAIMHSEPFGIDAKNGWKWISDESERYGSVEEFISISSEKYRIPVNKVIEEDSIGAKLRILSDFFISKGIHMMLLQG